MSSARRARGLADPPAIAFPFRVGPRGPASSSRAAHVREQIAQVLFTAPGERVFRPEFGAGIHALVFEPNAGPLWELARRRIQTTLGEALDGEVDPQSIEVDVTGEGERLEIEIRYRLLALDADQRERFSLGGGDRG